MSTIVSSTIHSGRVCKEGRAYDLNTLLQLTNIVVLVANVYLYLSVSGQNPYVDAATVMWSFLISMQVGFILWVERGVRSPLMILLAMNVIGNYVARILTLQIYPMSGVLIMTRMGGSLDVHDINNVLAFIFCGTWAIMAGLSLPPLKSRTMVNELELGPCRRTGEDIGKIITPQVLIGVFVLSMFSSVCFSFFKYLGDGVSMGERLMSYVNMLLCHDVIVLIVLTYLFTQRKRITKRHFNIMTVMFIVYLALRLLQGSRSGMLIVAMTMLSVWLAIYGFVKVRAKLVAIALLFILPLSLISFSIATTIRQVTGAERDEAYSSNEMEDIKEASMQRGYMSSDNEFILSMIFARIAYLTDATDIIANYKRYGELVNIEHIFMSIVDSTTPGFDVFDAGRISNRLKNVYTNQDLAYQFPANEYQSDALTVYGEYYTLFRGYVGLIPMFVIAYIFKLFYLFVRNRWGPDGLCSICYSALTLIIFRLWIDSYGTDWVILEGGRMVVMTTVFLYVMTRLSRKRIVMGWPVPQRMHEHAKGSCDGDR